MKSLILFLLSLFTLSENAGPEMFRVRFYEGYGPMGGFRSFILKDKVGFQMEDGSYCKTITLLPKDKHAIQSLMAAYNMEKNGFSKSDTNLVCEGGRSLVINIGKKQFAFSPPCREKRLPSDYRLEKGMDSIILHLDKIFYERGTDCQKGRYLAVYDVQKLFGWNEACVVISKKRNEKYLPGIPWDLEQPIKEALLDPDFPYYLGNTYPGLDSLNNVNFSLGSKCVSIEIEQKR